ncbi:Imm1 family immunity protein [Streptomyces sp. NBC_01320]|uniref:Imm1 family immunity protein n=1 Tax=Streptomyces sp. NBC_01320 TaxID=2903824 RepID=UPI002E11AE7F|nr:hypothetical protein OG395_43780 [Streptomyces sp. NBC_01320]
MEGAVTAEQYLRFWHPTTNRETGLEVSQVGQVVAAAEKALELYREAGVEDFPGLSLWRGKDIPEDSLNIGVSLDSWVLIHTNEDFWQTVTRSTDHPGGPLRRVIFDDSLEISARCFIDRDLAIEAIAHWLNGNGLLDAANFSEDLDSE